MEKKQYTAPNAEIINNKFEDIIVASGGSSENKLNLITDLFNQ